MIDFVLAQTDAVGAAGPALVPSLWRTLGALAVVLALIGGLTWLLRRGTLARRSGQGLGIEAALSLGERRSLVVITVEGRRLLVGLAPNAVSLVTELAPPGATFDQTFARAAAAPEQGAVS